MEFIQNEKDLIIINTKDNNAHGKNNCCSSNYESVFFIYSCPRMMTSKEILLNLFNAAVALCKYLGGIRSSPVKA